MLKVAALILTFSCSETCALTKRHKSQIQSVERRFIKQNKKKKTFPETLQTKLV